MSEITRLSDLVKDGPIAERRFVEFTRAKDLSLGVYLLPKGGADHQSPHAEDEMYYIIRGRARFVSGSGSRDVAPGDVIYVAAREPHQFVDIAEDLVLLVAFAPAYRTREG
jgi:mannose-6-phosphate isomerase-like protein (cupin superfamily)